MRSKFEYFRAWSLSEALDFLAEHGPDTSVLAGGTDLSIAIRKGDMPSRFVLDISRVEATRAIRLDNDRLHIGATTTFTAINTSSLVQQCAPVLVRACRCIGSAQIRNVATLGGNVVNASPAADGVPPLLAMNAVALVQSVSGERLVSVAELVTGPYRTGLKPDELVTGFQLQRSSPGYRSSFHRIARRRALSVARINIAAVGSLDKEGKVSDVRIAPGSITPAPCRMRAAEKHLLGRRPSVELVLEAAEKVSHEMIVQSGLRPSTEYKKPAVQGLVIKALTELFLE